MLSSQFLSSGSESWMEFLPEFPWRLFMIPASGGISPRLSFLVDSWQKRAILPMTRLFRLDPMTEHHLELLMLP